MPKPKKKAPVTFASKDDGTRWVVMRDSQQVYPGLGSTQDHAQHLNNGLCEPGTLVQVK